MQTLAPAPAAPLTTSGPERARRNLCRNLNAMRRLQHASAIAPPGEPPTTPAGEFTRGRDGYLTFRTADGWAAGCSLPLRAARQQLKTMDVAGPVACLLDPPHAAHLRITLDRLKPTQAVVAVVLDSATLPVLLSCDDFSADVAAHRLWIVAGDEWSTALRALFDERPGLPVPMQFVRLGLPDADRLDPVIAEAQRVFAEVTAERGGRARARSAGWQTPAGPAALCVVTGRQFRLWHDAGPALAEAIRAAGDPSRIRALDADDPLTASGLAMLQAAAECGALLTADMARANVPDLLPHELPWTTWVTTPNLPAYAAAGPNDRLLVADPAWRGAALAAGWPGDRVEVGGWPQPLPPDDDSPAPRTPAEPHVAIIGDTVGLDPPARLDEFSSHRLLWDAIRSELLADPSLAGVDADAYLRARQRRFGVDDASLDRKLFLHHLVWPAVTQGTTRGLIAAGVPIRLYGEGWAALPAFAAHAAGPVTSRAHLARVASRAAGLLDARPANWRYGLWSLGRPVVRCGGRLSSAVRQDVSLVLSGCSRPAPAVPPISLDGLLERLVARP